MLEPIHATPTAGNPASGRLRARVVWTVALVLVVVAAVWLTIETNWISELSAFIARESPIVAIIEYAGSVLATLGYIGLVLIIFLENVFPPIPSDVMLPLAGFTAATGTMSLLGAILATTGGSLLGALTLYYAGYRLGEERVRRFAGRYGRYLTFEEAEIDRSVDWFRKHGSIVVMVARFVPVFRSLISIPAGMTRMPLGRFLTFTAIGAGTWNGALILAGYLLGANWELVVSWMEQYQVVMLGVYACVFAVFAFVRVRSYRKRKALREKMPE